MLEVTLGKDQASLPSCQRSDRTGSWSSPGMAPRSDTRTTSPIVASMSNANGTTKTATRASSPWVNAAALEGETPA